MYRILLSSCLFLFTTPLFCQKKNFVFGFQSGINYSSTLVTTEFQQTPLKGDFFIGSSFGIIARSKLFKYKWAWASFSNYYNVYAEYGLNYTYGGYNYYYKNQTIFQEQLNYQIPLLIVFRPVIQKYWYKKFKGNRVFPIVKTGLIFSTTPSKNIQKKYTFGEATLFEKVDINNALNIYYTGALGFQKEYKNGKIMYIGFSVHIPFFKRISGTIQVDSKQVNEIAKIEKTGNFYSIDIQYFFGEGNKDAKQKRKRKRGKLPKIIYNPRYY